MKDIILDMIAFAIIVGSFITMAMTLVISAFHGYTISMTCNRYGEAWFEIIGVIIATPFVLWRIKVWLLKDLEERIFTCERIKGW